MTQFTVKNTVISPNFLVWKYCGKTHSGYSLSLRYFFSVINEKYHSWIRLLRCFNSVLLDTLCPLCCFSSLLYGWDIILFSLCCYISLLLHTLCFQNYTLYDYYLNLPYNYSVLFVSKFGGEDSWCSLTCRVLSRNLVLSKQGREAFKTILD